MLCHSSVKHKISAGGFPVHVAAALASILIYGTSRCRTRSPAAEPAVPLQNQPLTLSGTLLV